MESITQKNLNALSINAMFDRRIKPIHKAIKTVFKFPYVSSFDNLFSIAYALNTPLYRRCYHCNASLPDALLNHVNDVYICDDCKKDYYRECDHCHEMMPFEDTPTDKISRNPVIGERGEHLFVCHRCKESHYDYCDVCKKFIPKNNLVKFSISGNNKYYCPDCFKDFSAKMKKCTQCNSYTPAENMIGSICFHCHITNVTKTKKKEISSYGKTEGKVFLSTIDDGKCYGVEIEVSDGNESDSLKQQLNEYPEIELKRDGSVPMGFEIVSYPLSLGYHKSMMKWSKLFAILESHGYKSHDSNASCGYHIHMSRLSFGDTIRKQSKYNAYFLYLIESNQTQIKKFSRRQDFRYCKFYNINYQNISVTRAYQSAVNKNRHDRFMVMNYQNKHTVECRVFKGTLNHNTFIAAMELLEHLKAIAINCKNETELKSFNWNKIMQTIPNEYTSLKAYCTKKNLLVV